MFTGGISRRGLVAKSRRHRDQILRSAIESLEPRRLLSAGTLDTTFNHTGVAVSALTGPQINGVFSAMVEQPDGKFVVGSSVVGTSGTEYFGLSRYNANGTLDNSFGVNGTVITPVATGSGVVTLNDIALDPANGDIAEVGVNSGGGPGGTSEVVVNEVNSDGHTDFAFNGGSPYSFVFGGDDATQPTNMTLAAVDSNGDIVVAGPHGNTVASVAVARITPAGKLDTTFNPGGLYSNSSYAGEEIASYSGYSVFPEAIAITPMTNQIVIVGAANGPDSTSIAVTWLENNGQANTNFFSGGTQIGFEFPNNATSTGTAVAIDGGDGLIIAGPPGRSPDSAGDFDVMRVTQYGLQDLTFDGGLGSTEVPFVGSTYSTPTSVAINPYTQQIIVGGDVTLPATQLEFGVAVLQGDGPNDGKLDDSFNGTGTEYLAQAGGGSVYAPISMALDSDGDILLAGTGYSSSLPAGDYSGIALAEFNSTGGADATLNGSGTEVTAFYGAEQTQTLATAVEPNGNILVAQGSAYTSQIYLTEYNSDGSLDSTFGVDGTVAVAAAGTLPSTGFVPSSLAVASDGTIYLAGDDFSGNVSTGIQVLSYNSNGASNDSFGDHGSASIAFGGDNYTKLAGIAVDGDGNVVVAGTQGTVDLSSGQV
ncbi:MAG: hypothetical protein ABSH22_23170, partial [Tepidisphaeraceae bacterium]